MYSMYQCHKKELKRTVSVVNNKSLVIFLVSQLTLFITSRADVNTFLTIIVRQCFDGCCSYCELVLTWRCSLLTEITQLTAIVPTLVQL